MTASECLAALTAGVLHVSRQRSLTLIQKVGKSYFTTTTARTPLADCASASGFARLYSRLWLPSQCWLQLACSRSRPAPIIF